LLALAELLRHLLQPVPSLPFTSRNFRIAAGVSGGCCGGPMHGGCGVYYLDALATEFQDEIERSA